MDLGQHLNKCTTPTTRQVSKSDRSLPTKTVEVVRKLLGPLPSAQPLAHWSNTPVVGTLFCRCKLVWAAAGTRNKTFQHGISAWRSIKTLQHDGPSRHFSITVQYGTSALPFSFPVTLTLTCAVSLFVAKTLETSKANGLLLPEIHHKRFNVFSAPAKHSGGPGFEHNCSHVLT